MQHNHSLEVEELDQELERGEKAETEDTAAETDCDFLEDEEFWKAIDDELETKRSHPESPLSAPAKYERNTESLISQVLKGKNPDFRANVINTAYRYGLDKNDPLFIVLLATGQLELLLENKPDEIDAFFQDWQLKWQSNLKDSQAVISQELDQVQQFIDHWAQDSREILERQSKAAITVQSRNISNSVKTLVRQAALEKVAHDIWSVIFGSGVVFGSITIGVFVGLAIPNFTPSPELDPTGARQLTLKEASALEWGLSNEGQFAQKNADTIRWVMSNEGKYARQFMSWNQALLSKKNGKKLCETEVNRLGVTLTVEGKASQGGFCTLWTRPPQERVFINH